MGLYVDKKSGKVIVRAAVNGNCKAIVRFIEENVYFSEECETNKEYISNLVAEADVVAIKGVNSVEAEAVIIGTLPEHFVMDAVLVDSEGKEVSDHFLSIENTQKYEAFDSKTVEDFAGENVLNFDSKTNSFGVLADDVLMLNAKSITEVTLEDSQDINYLITGLSGKISAGDKVYVRDEEGKEALFKVSDVSENGESTTVVPVNANDDNGYGLVDFYKFLKVSMVAEGTVNKPEEATSPLSSTNKPQAKFFDIDIPTLKRQLNEYVTFEGNIEGRIGIYVGFVYDPEAFGRDYFECHVELICDFDLIATITARIGSEEEDGELKEDTIMVDVPTPPLFAGFSPKLEVGAYIAWEVKGIVTIKINVDKTVGFTYNPVKGAKKISYGKGATPSVDLDAEATLKMGPKLALGLEFLKGVVSVGIEVKRGIEFYGSSMWLDECVEKHQGAHRCYSCFIGKLDEVWDVSAEISVKPLEEILKPFDISIFSFRRNIYIGTISRETKDSEYEVKDVICNNFTVKTVVDVQELHSEGPYWCCYDGKHPTTVYRVIIYDYDGNVVCDTEGNTIIELDATRSYTVEVRGKSACQGWSLVAMSSNVYIKRRLRADLQVTAYVHEGTDPYCVILLFDLVGDYSGE